VTSIYEKRISNLEEKMGNLSKDSAVSTAIIDRFSESIDKLFKTLDDLNATLQTVQISMVSMQSEIKSNATAVSNLQTKVDSLEDNSKWDWQKWIKTIIPILITSGVIYGIVRLIEASIR